MKQYLAVLLSVLLLMISVPLVSADTIYNDDTLNWGEFSCPHNTIREVDAVASTCAVSGHAAYTFCVDCKLLLLGSRDPLPLAEHTYDSTYDAECNDCGHVREVLVPGDVDENGTVNNRDVGRLQQFLNEYDITVDEVAADLDGNGKINNRDLGLLLRLVNRH